MWKRCRCNLASSTRRFRQTAEAQVQNLLSNHESTYTPAPPESTIQIRLRARVLGRTEHEQSAPKKSDRTHLGRKIVFDSVLHLPNCSRTRPNEAQQVSFRGISDSNLVRPFGTASPCWCQDRRRFLHSADDAQLYFCLDKFDSRGEDPPFPSKQSPPL